VIAYFDSSSIVKWFFDEPLMDLSRGIKAEAAIAVTSLVAFPEVISAIHRAHKDGRCPAADMALVRDEFLRIWPDFQRVEINDELVQHAGRLIFKHSLRGFDALHLASALLLKNEAEALDLFFSCFDRGLNQAAQKEGLITHSV
jgi:predicted nucleic acid-binding protein